MIVIDSNIILDIVTQDSRWFDWSSSQLKTLAEDYKLLINDVIYSEISISFEYIEELENILVDNFIIQPIPKEALFLAGKAFLKYKKLGGTKTSTLPDFFIGAHASILNVPLLTRDKKRYKNYFPNLEIIAP
ncbi:MAG: DNA-binding protein [Rickettsiales bacterium]|nr:MAG: DNA-binding protein [Rickettsiales bacterium]